MLKTPALDAPTDPLSTAAFPPAGLTSATLLMHLKTHRAAPDPALLAAFYDQPLSTYPVEEYLLLLEPLLQAAYANAGTLMTWTHSMEKEDFLQEMRLIVFKCWMKLKKEERIGNFFGYCRVAVKRQLIEVAFRANRLPRHTEILPEHYRPHLPLSHLKAEQENERGFDTIEQNKTLTPFFADPTILNDPVEITLQENRREILRAILEKAQLTDKQAFVINRRFGFFDGRAWQPREIAEAFKITFAARQQKLHDDYYYKQTVSKLTAKAYQKILAIISCLDPDTIALLKEVP